MSVESSTLSPSEEAVSASPLLKKLNEFIASGNCSKLGTYTIEVDFLSRNILHVPNGQLPTLEQVRINLIRKKARDVGLKASMDASYIKGKTIIFINIVAGKK